MSNWLSEQADKVERGVASLEWEGQPARVVTAARDYATGIDDLWNALTDPERMKRWLMPISGDLRLGGRYQLQGNAGGTILECAPPNRLYVTWEMHGGISWVIVTLEARGEDATRLHLQHIAPESAEGMAFWDQFGPGAVGVGWDLSLLGLAMLVDHGGRPDGVAEDGWLISGEGRGFAEVSRPLVGRSVGSLRHRSGSRERRGRSHFRLLHRRTARLMHAFDILGDPVRRRILELLATGEMGAGELVEAIRGEFGISQPAVSQHLRVLRESGFASVRADAQKRLYAIDAAPIAEIEQWLAPFRRFWDHKLEALATEVARGKKAKKGGKRKKAALKHQPKVPKRRKAKG